MIINKSGENVYAVLIDDPYHLCITVKRKLSLSLNGFYPNTIRYQIVQYSPHSVAF